MMHPLSLSLPLSPSSAHSNNEQPTRGSSASTALCLAEPSEVPGPRPTGPTGLTSDCVSTVAAAHFAGHQFPLLLWESDALEATPPGRSLPEYLAGANAELRQQSHGICNYLNDLNLNDSK